MTPDKTCATLDCGSPAFCRGWCRKHYTRWHETGSTELGVRKGRTYTRRPIEDRFWPKVQKTDDCWLWTASKTRQGYGCISTGGQRGGHLMAHRVSWELANGPIPEGLHIDHLCRRPSCVNPAHLEPVTVAENTRRGYAPSLAAARQLAKTECRNGHPYDDANTHITKRGSRMCRTCIRERQRARRAALRQERTT